MKAAIVALIVLLAAATAGAQTLDTDIGKRKPYRTARFAWLLEGDNPLIVSYAIQCGRVPRQYSSVALTTMDAISMRVSEVLPRNSGVYYCLLSALDSVDDPIVDSNEIAVELRGQGVTRIK